MTKLEKIERDIAALDRAELARLRQWFQEYDAANWDQQIEADALSGRLDNLAEKAIAAHRARRTTAL